MTKAYVDTPYGQVHYRYGAPQKSTDINQTILLLHKSASSSSSYEKIAYLLIAKGFTCYAPDMPGFGSSFDPSPATIKIISEKNTAFYVGLYETVFKSLGVFGDGTKPVHIIGHHSGASLAMEMAAVFPDMVASITLVGPTVMSAEVRAEMRRNYYDAFNKPVPDGSHLQKTWDYLQHMGVGDDINLFQREAIDHIRAWRGRQLIYGSIWNQDMETYAKAAKCPALLVCSRDDVLFDHFAGAQEAIPTAESLILDDGANFSLDWCADAIVQKWSTFIAPVLSK